MTNQNVAERIKTLIAGFVLKYNFWGYLFSRVRRLPMENLPSIMGVASEPDGTITLYYQPKLVEGTSDEVLLKVIEHEGLHLLNKHLPRLMRIVTNETNDYHKKIKMNIFQIASDCAVNEQGNMPKILTIDGKPWPLIFPESYSLKSGQTTESYFMELIKQGKKHKKQKLVGSHDVWCNNLKGVPDLDALSRKVEQHVRGIIKETVKSFGKERGRLPAHISDLIEDILTPPKAPYYQIIRKLVRGSRFSKFTRSPTRINRKRTYTFHLNSVNSLPQISPFPGKQRDFTFNIVVLIDTSGSMSNDDIREGLSGIKNIIEKDKHCHTTVLEVDSGIEKEYVCRRIYDIQYNIKGRGGTTLTPGLIRARELQCDVCLAFTDGYTENINEIPRKKLPKKLIWVITRNGTSETVNKTGFVVKI